MNFDPDLFFSHRARQMRASEIRELLKLTQQPDIISFAGGLPSPDSFPYKEVQSIVDGIMADRTRAAAALQYSETEGVRVLREDLIGLMSRWWGMNPDIEEVLVTTASQQGLDLASRVFIDPHDEIIVGAPTYLGGSSAYNAFHAKMNPVPLDDNGYQPDLVEEKVRTINQKGRRVKFLYTIPTFHNPSSITMPEKRRKALLDLAHEYDFLILEDDPYSRLRYDGEDVKPIKAFDTEGRVVYFATFSKLLAPAFRLGFIIAHPEIAKKLVFAKQSTDLCTGAFVQHIAHDYIVQGHLDRHIPKVIAMYRRKRDIMVASMEKYFPPEVKFTRPLGGMFSWAVCPPQMDVTKQVFLDAVANKVAYVTGRAFYVDGSGTNTMRLNFSNPSDENIATGCKRLGEVLERAVERLAEVEPGKAKPHAKDAA